MKKIIIIIALFSLNSWAGLFDVPLRSLELKSRIQISTSLLDHISAPNTLYIQDAQVQYLGVDEKRSYCSLTKFIQTDASNEFESFTLDAVEGAFVYAPSWLLTSSFRTTLKLSNSKQFIELSCINPISNSQKVEELNFSGLNSIWGNYLQLESFNINSGDFKPRFSPQITNDFIANKLKIKINKNIELINSDESPNHFEAEIGKCKLFSIGEKTSIKQGEELKPNSYEVVYTNDGLVNQKPTIILRFNDNFGMMCEGNSNKRMFDYQDFWDATGKTDVDWVISL